MFFHLSTCFERNAHSVLGVLHYYDYLRGLVSYFSKNPGKYITKKCLQKVRRKSHRWRPVKLNQKCFRNQLVKHSVHRTRASTQLRLESSIKTRNIPEAKSTERKGHSKDILSEAELNTRIHIMNIKSDFNRKHLCTFW